MINQCKTTNKGKGVYIAQKCYKMFRQWSRQYLQFYEGLLHRLL